MSVWKKFAKWSALCVVSSYLIGSDETSADLAESVDLVPVAQRTATVDGSRDTIVIQKVAH
jgi:hypothetical protein